MRKLGNGNNVSGKQNNVTILILTFIMIILVVFSISISCGPKNVEKYIGKLHKLKEKLMLKMMVEMKLLQKEYLTIYLH